MVPSEARQCLVNRSDGGKLIPEWLKPEFFRGVCGTAKAMPYYKACDLRDL